METPPVLLLIFAMKILQNKIVSPEQEGNLKLDESCISNPKSETANWTVLGARSNPIFRDFGFEMQDSSNFKMSSPD